MFKKIEIKRFRGIKDAVIGDFKRVNLFFGRNNCGKSSLLDALFLATGLSNPLLPINVNVMRGYNKTRLKDLELNFYNLDSAQPIHICVENKEKRNIEISLFENNKRDVSFDTNTIDIHSNVIEGEYGLKFNFEINDESFESELRFDLSTTTNTIDFPKKYVESLRCIYLTPKYDFNTSIQGLENILKNKDEDFIIEGLRFIEPRVKDFIFTEEGIFVDIGIEKRIPINMMGDGVRKIVSLLTVIYDCRDGIVLIDEISNGFHYSVMSNLWNVIIKAAIKNNTQLFITTHDYDSIKGLRDTALNIYDENVATFKLLRTSDDELKALHYSLESVDYSINQEIEIR
ncbi:MAG: AAA family ATPase [Bacteroidales bacterium]|nr:AAA family ATPase [Bacteroidales bacterium]MEE0982681.1 AAA family ATPase [Bacteroidales bacterium]MEE0993229.1 AAA family ATPase [Bacteroidales bacterium]MEE1001329.1 AAA family ATPase [Bacteroidales bacterium]